MPPGVSHPAASALLCFATHLDNQKSCADFINGGCRRGQVSGGLVRTSPRACPHPTHQWPSLVFPSGGSGVQGGGGLGGGETPPQSHTPSPERTLWAQGCGNQGGKDGWGGIPPAHATHIPQPPQAFASLGSCYVTAAHRVNSTDLSHRACVGTASRPPSTSCRPRFQCEHPGSTPPPRAATGSGRLEMDRERVTPPPIAPHRLSPSDRIQQAALRAAVG